jgi:integrase
MQLIQDRFLWQCYTGLRFGTAFIVKQEHITNGWLYIKPSKTIRFEVRVEQPLNFVAIELLEKYNYDMTLLKITNQAYNRELKDMFSTLKKEYPALNYQTEYSTYCSRDTFITLAVQKGANWKDILRWVGQSSYSIMDRYIKPEDKQQEKKVKSIFPKPTKPKN